jgi:hypothetical protein
MRFSGAWLKVLALQYLFSLCAGRHSLDEALVFSVLTTSLVCQRSVVDSSHYFGVRGLSNIVDNTLVNAPNGYAPVTSSCPSERPFIRSAATLSPRETSWLDARNKNMVNPISDLLSRLNITDFDVVSYFNAHATIIRLCRTSRLQLLGEAIERT